VLQRCRYLSGLFMNVSFTKSVSDVYRVTFSGNVVGIMTAL